MKYPVLALLCLLTPLKLSAHPHSWIELNTRILSNEQAITGFAMEWTFDAMTSAYMLDGEDLSPEARETTMKNLAMSVMDNMLYEHYFTYFYDGDEPIRYKQVMDASLTQKRGKLTLHFELPLAKPKPFKDQNLKLMIFEPSYYVDMSWKTHQSLTLSGPVQSQCQLKMVEPNPTAEQMAYAISLPQDADPDNALGQLFTQHAFVDCRQP